jgi:hypothetical protein
MKTVYEGGGRKKKKKSEPINYDTGPAYQTSAGSRTVREDKLKRQMARDGVELDVKHVRRADGSEYTRSVDSSPADEYKKGGKYKVKKKKSKSRVNEAGNYTKPGMRKRLFNKIKAGSKGGKPGQWSARKAQMLAQQYKKAGGGYRD